MNKPGQGTPEQAEKRRQRQRIERKPEAKDAANNHGVGLASRSGGGICTAAIWRSADAKRGGNDGQSSLTFDAGMLFEGGTVEAQTQVLQRLDGTQRQKAIQRIARVQGNQHVQRVVAAYGGNGRGRVSPTAQTKLEVGEPDDAYEKEADAVAEQVMRMPTLAPPPPAEGTSSSEEQGGQGTQKHSHFPTISRLSIPVSSPRPAGDGLVARAEEVESYEEEEEPAEAERLSMAAGGDGDDNGAGKPGVPTVDAGLEGRIGQLKGSGSPLPPSDREFFESRFGADFGDVRVHTGDTATQTAQDLSARAYTVGSDIAFGAGEYAPGTERGRKLMAHELTHVVQQGGAGALQREPEDTIRRSEEEVTGGGGEAAAPPVPAAGSGPAEPAGAGEGGASQPGGNGAGPRGAVTPVAPAASGKSAGDNGAGAKAAEALAAGSKATFSPGQDPGFQAVAGRVGAVADRERTHEEPGTEAEEAQEAAEPPTNELESKAQDQQVQEMEQQKPGEFSAAAFKAALLAKIKEITPKKLKDVDEFKKKSPISAVRDRVKQKIAEQKARSMGVLEEKVEETPDTSGIEPKPVTPMDQPDVGPAPGDIRAGEAAPKPKKQDEIEDPLLRESAGLDRDLEKAGITEEQLAESNEPQFLATLKAKKDAQAYVAESLPAYRKDEGQIVAGAQQEAQTAVVGPLEGMHGSREGLLAAVFSEQYDTKAADEGKRGEVATAINQIYETTKKDVVGILDPLSDEVEKRFDTAAKKARRLFEDHVDREMKAYKKKRYGGLFGWAKWLKDKLLGMPKEVNRFYEDGRQLYINTMDGELDGIAAHVAAELNKAMACIAQGRQEITEYVESLPEELQQIGTDAANEIQTKFDDLEQDVRDKQTELIDTLANKYQENLQELDARIEELKAANRGLIAKAIDFVKNVIATVTQLAALLARILLKAASAIPQILLHPIRFLKNLLQGVKQGLRNFVKNIGQHLQSAVLEWLTGATGLQLPATLDAKGLFSLVLQVLGLTYANIRERAVNIFGEKTVAYLEKGFEVFKILVTEGPVGLWEYIKDKVGDLKAMIIDRIKNLIKTKIIKAGIDWIVSMLGGPAGAFIKAVKAIIKVVKWFLENAKKIMALIEAVLDSILAIASGSVEEAANKIEQALAKQIPVVISFLADLVGVGDLSGSVRKIIADVRKPINSAIDWVLKKVKEFVIKVGHKLGIGGEEETEEDKQERLDNALKEAQEAVDTKFGGSETRQSDIEPILVDVKQKYALTELAPIERGDVWAVYGKVNPDGEEKTKARVAEGGGFAIKAFPGSVVTLGSKVQYAVEHTRPKLISADSSYHYEWFFENDPSTTPASKRHEEGPRNAAEWTLNTVYPGTHYVCAKIFLDNELVVTLGYKQEVETGGAYAIKAHNDPVVKVGSKVKYSVVVKGEQVTPAESSGRWYSWVIEDDPDSTPVSMRLFREIIVDKKTASVKTERPGILLVTLRVMGGKQIETVSLKQKVVPKDKRDAAILDWIQGALDVAGLFPGLGVFPDAINTGIYLIRGKWTEAGISAMAMAPVFGQGATATKYVVRATREGVEQVGEAGLKKGMREVVEASGKRGVKKVAGAIPLNRAGKSYPKATVKGYGEVSFPSSSTIAKTDPKPLRAKFTKKLKNDFKDWWHKKYGWYPPKGEYEIHHIQPLSRGGINSFENLVPLRTGAEHDQFTTWWLTYP